MSMITEEFGVIPPDIQTQMLIAPVMGEMIATQAFAIGEQFIVNSTLYKATKAIAIGDTISVGTSANDNCILSDTISQQIKAIPYLTSSTKTDICDSTTTSLTSISLEKWGRIQTLAISGGSIPAGTWTSLGVLKSDFRPSANLTFPAMTSNETEARISIRADGTMQIFNSSGSQSNATGSITFIGK